MDRVLGIVQAGGAGSRLDVLTRERAKPSLPFAGEYRLVDFALSSLAVSRVPDVWVDVQYLASSLHDHLAGGRPWDLDRTRGGFRIIAAEQGAAAFDAGFSTGNADALSKMWRLVEAADPEIVLVLSADSVFHSDLRAAIEHHRERGAECTILTAEVSRAEAEQNAALDVAADGTVREVAYKEPGADLTTVSTEITVYDAATLGQCLRELVVRDHDEAEQHDPHAAESGLGDFGESLLPWFVERGRTVAFPLAGYWRDMGRPEVYLGAHRDLLAGRVDVFDGPGAVLTHAYPMPGAFLGDEADVTGSIIASGARVRGTVRRSVLGYGVTVEAGAHVEDCVLMDGVSVRAGARVHTAIVDEDAEIGRDARVGAAPAGTRPRPGDIVLVGRESRIGGGVTLDAGARLEPGTTV